LTEKPTQNAKRTQRYDDWYVLMRNLGHWYERGKSDQCVSFIFETSIFVNKLMMKYRF